MINFYSNKSENSRKNLSKKYQIFEKKKFKNTYDHMKKTLSSTY